VRSLPVVLVTLLLVAGCGDDDDDLRGASVTTTSTTSTTSTTATPDPDEVCPGADLVPPAAVDGGPAEIVAAHGALTFAVVDRGASIDVVSPFVVVDCAYEPVSIDGTPALIAIGGSVTHGGGLRCEGDTLTVLSATSEDGRTYETEAVTYELDGATLVEVDRSTSTIDATEDPADLDPYYRLDC